MSEFVLPGEQPPTPPARGRLHAGLRALFYFLAWLALTVAAQLAGMVIYGLARVAMGAAGSLQAELTGDGMPPLPLLALATYLGFGAALLVTWIFTTYVSERPFTSIGLEPVRNWGLQWLAGFGVETLHFAAVFGVGLAAGWYRVLGTASVGESLVILLVALAIAIPAAAVEEIVTRGYILQTLEEKYGAGWALVASSLLFALLHAFNPSGWEWRSMIGLFLAGAYLGAAYLATRQLWFPIALHAAWNVCEGPVFGLPVSGMQMPATILRVEAGGPPLWTGGDFGPEAGLLVFITTALWTGVVWWVGRRLRRDVPAPGGPVGSAET